MSALDGTMALGAATDPERGLSTAEAAARLAAGLGNPPPSTTRSYRQIARENILTFVNTVIFVLGVALVAVGRPLDAIISTGVIATNILVGIAQEVRAKRALDRITLLTRPTVTAVRDGEPRDEALDQVVVGDLIEVLAGDQLVADGTFASGHASLDESQLKVARQPRQHQRMAPDEVVAYLRSLPTLWNDAGPEGRQALASALFAKLEVEGYTKMRYELTPDAVDLGLGAALPAQLETGGHTGGFGRGERSRAYTFQISVAVLDGDGRSIVYQSTDVA